MTTTEVIALQNNPNEPRFSKREQLMVDEMLRLSREVARLRERMSLDQTTAAELSGQYTNEQAELRAEVARLSIENAQRKEQLDDANTNCKALRAEVARLREALQYIAKQPTDQTASPAQCSMVAVAMEALVAGRDSKEVAK